MQIIIIDTSVESANLHVIAINFQLFLFCTQNKNSMQYPVAFVYFIEGVQNKNSMQYPVVFVYFIEGV